MDYIDSNYKNNFCGTSNSDNIIIIEVFCS